MSDVNYATIIISVIKGVTHFRLEFNRLNNYYYNKVTVN